MLASCTEYLTKVVRQGLRRHTIQKVTEDLSILIQNGLEFDSIVCTGLSGLLIAPSVADILDKQIIVIRKNNEQSHSDYSIEGFVESPYIIIDDCISTGNTINRIVDQMKHSGYDPKCLGVYLYAPEHISFTSDYILSNLISCPFLHEAVKYI